MHCIWASALFINRHQMQDDKALNGEVADFIAFVKSRSERPARHTPAQKERLLTLLAQAQQEPVFRMIPDALRWQEDQRDAWA